VLGVLGTIVRKELLQGLLTFRFVAALILMTTLWGSSLWIFVRDYQARSARSVRSERIRELEEEKLVRIRLAESLRWIVSQRLLPRKGGGRVAAFEVLITTSAVEISSSWAATVGGGGELMLRKSGNCRSRT